MPYDYVRHIFENNGRIEDAEYDTIQGHLADGFKIHTCQILPLENGHYSTFMLFERYIEEEVIPPEPMRCT